MSERAMKSVRARIVAALEAAARQHHEQAHAEHIVKAPASTHVGRSGRFCWYGHDVSEPGSRTKPRGSHRNGECRECARARASTKESRVRWRCRFYSLSRETVVTLLARGRCDLCERPTSNLEFDHDHKCCAGERSCGRCIRGVLCRGCNIKLGKRSDRPWSPESEAYLARYRARADAEVTA